LLMSGPIASVNTSSTRSLSNGRRRGGVLRLVGGMHLILIVLMLLENSEYLRVIKYYQLNRFMVSDSHFFEIQCQRLILTRLNLILGTFGVIGDGNKAVVTVGVHIRSPNISSVVLPSFVLATLA
jgi:hypothetical protein